MLGFFRKPKKSPTVASRLRRADPLLWAKNTTLPIPDWEAVVPPEGVDLDEYLSAAAHDWLLRLGEQLSSSYSVAESEKFMLLSPLEERQRELILGFSETARSRILSLLPGIASDSGHGKTVILIFDDQDQYYQYVANYYSDSDAAEGRELALSGGMYLNRGYGHFVFVSNDLALVEPVIAHELTHSLLSHLPLPAWVNEGIDLNIHLHCLVLDGVNTGSRLEVATTARRLPAFSPRSTHSRTSRSSEP